jgi:hypothetical protein
MADTVGLALLVVLETLTPSERVAYVLHDMFALPFAEIGDIIDRSPEAARQLASRARRRVRRATPQPDADLADQREVIDAFLAASRAGDFDALVAVLDPAVVLRAPGAPGLERERTGAADVARTWATFGPSFASLCQPAIVNGQAGLVLKSRPGVVGAVGFTLTSGLITTIDVSLDPHKVEGFDQLLSIAGGRQRSVAEWIISEALSWPGVHREKGEFGSVVLLVDQCELGHLHGDVVADVPLGHDAGWATISLETEEGAQRALAMLRCNYTRAKPTAASGP